MSPLIYTRKTFSCWLLFCFLLVCFFGFVFCRFELCEILTSEVLSRVFNPWPSCDKDTVTFLGQCQILSSCKTQGQTSINMLHKSLSLNNFHVKIPSMGHICDLMTFFLTEKSFEWEGGKSFTTHQKQPILFTFCSTSWRPYWGYSPQRVCFFYSLGHTTSQFVFVMRILTLWHVLKPRQTGRYSNYKQARSPIDVVIGTFTEARVQVRRGLSAIPCVIVRHSFTGKINILFQNKKDTKRDWMNVVFRTKKKNPN